MNPINVNSANIKTFGFKTTFDLFNRTIKIDLAGLTEYVGSGNENTQGVWIEIIDPSGVKISAINFSVAAAIDTAGGDTDKTFDIPQGDSIFGVWQIKAVIKDEDDSLYYAANPPKEICKPKNFINDSTSSNNTVEGTFDIKVDCTAPFIRVTETTPFVYGGLTPSTPPTKNGKLYFPQSLEINPVAFTNTPLQDNRVYTGTYTVRCQSIALYDLGDYVFVEIRYNSNKERKVTCQEKVCDILCCVNDARTKYKSICATTEGKTLKGKLDDVGILLFIAMGNERCGHDSGEQVEEIRKILNCDCDCQGKAVEATAIAGGGGDVNINVVGICDTTVTPSTSGQTITYTVKTKRIGFVKADEEDLAWSIEKKSYDECQDNYYISFDYNILAGNILDAISLSDELKTDLNNLVTQIGIDLSGLDGKCIFNNLTCDFVLQQKLQAGQQINSIKIGATVYNSPSITFNPASVVALLSWLNGLGLGVFAATVDGAGPNYTLTITSTANTAKPVYMQFFGDAGTKKSFSSICKQLVQVLQAMVNYICAMDLANLKTGVEFLICSYDVDGNEETITVPADVTAEVLMDTVETALCRIRTKIQSVVNVTCATLKTICPVRPDDPINATDGLFGTKSSGLCTLVSYKEIALKLIEYFKNDPEVKAQFCTIQCSSPDVECPNINNFTATPAGTTGDDDANITITAVDWSIAPLVNKVVRIEYKVYGSGVWTEAADDVVVLPNGNLSVPFVIEDGIVDGGSYDVRITPVACGLGFAKIYSVPAVEGATFINFRNLMSVDAYTITQIKIDAGANILSSPLAPGDNFAYDYSGIGAGPHAVKMEFVIISEEETIQLKQSQIRSLTIIQSGYFTYPGSGVMTVEAVANFVNGDLIFIRNADQHRKEDSYVPFEGTVVATCALSSYNISRSSEATGDATVKGETVEVTVRWHTSNGGTLDTVVTFAPGDNFKTGSTADIGAGGCVSAYGEIISVVVV